MAKTLQLLRNAAVFENKAAALASLQANLPDGAAGEPRIACYTDGDAVSILLGISYGDGTNYQIFEGAKLSDDGSAIELPEEVKDAIDQAKNYADTKIAAAVEALDFDDSAVAMQFVTAVDEVNGVISVSRAAVTSTGGTVNITANGEGIDLSVDQSHIDAYKGKDAIAVAADADVDGKKVISLTINTADQVLTQTVDGLLANLNLTWSAKDGLKLIGKEGVEIATIPATDFVKDGMLENVELVVATPEDPVGEETSGSFLVFTFNTDGNSKVINVNVTDLIDVYTGSNGVQVQGKAISAVRDASSEAFFYIGATGIGVSGVTNAISSAVAPVQTEVDAIETAVGLGENGSFTAPTGATYVSGATTVLESITMLDKQAKANSDAIAAEETRATEAEAGLQDAIDAEEAAREAADSAINESITQINETIEQIKTDAVSLVAGNGISVTGDTAEKTIAAVADPADTFIEVGAAGIRMKDNGVIDLGTY